MKWIRSHLKIVVPVTLAVTAGLAYLAFGVFAIQTLFIDDKVDEAGPVFASGAGVESTVELNADPIDVVPIDVVPTDDVTTDDRVDAVPSTVPPSTVPPSDESDSTAPEVVTLSEGSFISRAHGGEGIASVLTDGSDQRFLRFEQFATDNGPDLNVYLTTADADAPDGDFDDAGEFVDLGDLKGNIGDQNYEIPPDVDLDRFDTVVVWCVRFSVSFTTADLVPAT